MVADSGLVRLLERLSPSELVLRDWVAPQLDSSMVDEIAAADYGMDVDENRRAVLELLQIGRLPDALPWQPEEVLALTRWSTLDASQPARLHLIRLFSCLILMRARTGSGGPVSSLTPLVASAIVLGPAAIEATGAYLAWCRINEPGDWRDDPTAKPFLTLALVMVSALLPVGRSADLLPDLTGILVEDLADAVEAEDIEWTQRPIRDLLKLAAQSDTRRIWFSLADRYLLGAAAQDTGHGDRLALLGQAIRGDLVADVGELRSLLRFGSEPGEKLDDAESDLDGQEDPE